MHIRSIVMAVLLACLMAPVAVLSCVLDDHGVACDDNCPTTTSSMTSSTGDPTGGGFGGKGGSGGDTVSSTVTTGSVGGGSGQGGATTSTSSMGGGGSGGCDVSEKDCDGNCVALDLPTFGCEDPACAPCVFANATATCTAGACDIATCDSGFANCDGEGGNGCETPTDNDPMNCGDCNIVCGAEQICQGGLCHNLCGSQPIPAVGWAACWKLNKNTLAVGTYATMTVAVNQPALSGNSDPYTPDCISPFPADANDTNDPSVLCPLGQVSGMTVYMALKSYQNNVGNPPLPFSADKCDAQTATQSSPKCSEPIELYFDGMLQFTFVDPPVAPFSYHDLNLPEPLQLKAGL